MINESFYREELHWLILKQLCPSGQVSKRWHGAYMVSDINAKELLILWLHTYKINYEVTKILIIITLS